MLQLRGAIHLGAPVDLLIDREEIIAMAPAGRQEAPEACEIFDAGGLSLLPSLIDAHVHLREPGQEWKEDIKSGLSAACHGGFGAVMAMANTKPVCDSASVALFMRNKAKESWPDGPDLHPIAAATINLEGKELAPLAELASAGCAAVSNDGKPLASAEMTRRVMEYAYDLGLILIDHCEDPDLARGWLLNEGETSARLGVKGQPGLGEALQAARDAMLSETLGIPVHIAHVSSALTVDVIERAKERGVKLTAETTPHYLLLTEKAADNFNTLAKVSPPLRTEADRQALIKAVKTGVIDILATDHAPHAACEKDETLDLAPFGITGLDLALPLSWRLVERGELEEADLHRLWSRNPAKIFNLPYNEFNPGDPASFILYDPSFEWKAEKENFHSKSWNTPFLGETMKGRTIHHWIRGKQIF